MVTSCATAVDVQTFCFCPQSEFGCKKQQLFRYTEITDWFCNQDGVCLLRGTNWVFIYNSTFCPHSVFMCFVWIWEQTAIISLYNINWPVCITETECVYCAVRTVSLYIIEVNFPVTPQGRIFPSEHSISLQCTVTPTRLPAITQSLWLFQKTKTARFSEPSTLVNQTALWRHNPDDQSF